MSTSVDKKKIDEAIIKVFEIILNTKNVTARYIAGIVIASVWLDAYDFASFSYGVNSFQATFPWIPAWLLGLVAIATDIGALFGTIFGGWLTDRLGRRIMFAVNMALFTLAAIGAGFAPDPYTAFALRTALGFALGADVATGFTYLFEYLGKTQRLWWSYFWNLYWYSSYLGVALGFMLPFFILYHTLTAPIIWRIIMWIGGVWAFIIFLLRVRVPESIMWEAYRGRLATVRRLIKQTYGIDLPPDIPDVDVEIRGVARTFRSLFSIFKRERWRELTYVFLGEFQQCFEFWGFAFYIPYVLILLKVFGPLATIAVSAIAYGVGGVTMGLAIPWLALKVNTKYLYSIGAIGTGLMAITGALTILYHWPPIIMAIAMTLFVALHVIGPSSQSQVGGTLIFHPKERGTGSGWNYFICKSAAVFAGVGAPVLILVRGVPFAYSVVATISIFTGLLGLFIGYDWRTYKPPELEKTHLEK